MSDAPARREQPARTEPQRTRAGRSRGESEPGPDVLLAQVEADRQRLAETIDGLLTRAAPAAVAERTKRRVTEYFVTPDGQPRTASIVRAGIVAGGVAAGAVGLWLLRRRFHR